ncbi:MAG TPA: hypothetical protein PLR60_05460 [Syntrophorhabdaceae bacterium]|nr:hypothetical protein [Syntrophorhabdaceae bacterium]
MAGLYSLRHFPIVKVIPLSVLDGEKEKMGDTALGGIVSSAIESLRDIQMLWESDHGDNGLRDGFQKLRYQLEYLRKYCQGDEAILK